MVEQQKMKQSNQSSLNMKLQLQTVGLSLFQRNIIRMITATYVHQLYSQVIIVYEFIQEVYFKASGYTNYNGILFTAH